LNIVYRDLKPVTRPKTTHRLNPGQWRITSAPWAVSQSWC
jgi:hypothetical protein